jgi:hypothetical protein
MLTVSLQKCVALRTGGLALPVALLLAALLLTGQRSYSQTTATKADSPVASETPKPGDNAPAKPEVKSGPLTDKEREELLELIKNLQERVTKLESAQTAGSGGVPQNQSAAPVYPRSSSPIYDGSAPPKNPTPSTDPSTAAKAQDKDKNDDKLNKGVPILKPWYEWEPGEGFKVAQSEIASLNIGGYLAVRYLNQIHRGERTFVDHLGRIREVKPRQDFQFHRAMLFLQGFVFNPKVSYNVTLWTVNDTAQNAIIGGISYAINKHAIIGMGWNALPGTRSLHGSHPYWPSYDRVMADEFFRPFFTQGFFAQGEITKTLKYDFMIGNNMSNLDVKATKLDRNLAFGGSLTWKPTTGEFGPRSAFGDFEGHQKLATQFGVAYTRARDDRQNLDDLKAAPENTVIKLADSLNVFEYGALAEGVTVKKLKYQLYAADAGMKYKGLWLQAEVYYRILDDFEANGVIPMTSIQDKGFYVQGSYMAVPKLFEVYGATSWIFSRMGDPKEFIVGANYYPFRNRNFRINFHGVNVDRSPVSSTFGYYTAGLKGWSITAGSSVLF